MKTAKLLLFAVFLVCAVTFLPAQERQTQPPEGAKAATMQQTQPVEAARPALLREACTTDATGDDASGYERQQNMSGDEYNCEPAVQTDYLADGPKAETLKELYPDYYYY